MTPVSCSRIIVGLVAFSAAVPYLCGAFVSLDFNPANWPWIVRAAVATIFCVILVAATTQVLVDWILRSQRGE